jgi:hypothetical protein
MTMFDNYRNTNGDEKTEGSLGGHFSIEIT